MSAARAADAPAPRPTCGKRSPGEAQRDRAGQGDFPRIEPVVIPPHPNRLRASFARLAPVIGARELTASAVILSFRGRRVRDYRSSVQNGQPKFQHTLSDTRQRPAVLRARDFARTFRPYLNKGRGECRVANAPAASCALSSEVCARGFTAKAPETSGIPHAMVLRRIALSPQGPSFFAPIIPQAIAHRCPVGLARPSRNLTQASGCQDHTPPWPSASAPFVLHALITHG